MKSRPFALALAAGAVLAFFSSCGGGKTSSTPTTVTTPTQRPRPSTDLGGTSFNVRGGGASFTNVTSARGHSDVDGWPGDSASTSTRPTPAARDWIPSPRAPADPGPGHQAQAPSGRIFPGADGKISIWIVNLGTTTDRSAGVRHHDGRAIQQATAGRRRPYRDPGAPLAHRQLGTRPGPGSHHVSGRSANRRLRVSSRRAGRGRELDRPSRRVRGLRPHPAQRRRPHLRLAGRSRVERRRSRWRPAHQGEQPPLLPARRDRAQGPLRAAGHHRRGRLERPQGLVGRQWQLDRSTSSARLSS